MSFWFRRLLIVLALCGPATTQAQTLSVTGPTELVLSHDNMNCGRKERGSGQDVTDVPVTAFRRKGGSVVVIAGNQNNYFLEGPSVDQARRTSCNSLVEPVNDPDPSHFTARRWLFAIFAKSYDFVLGFVHNEYHGSDFFGNECEKAESRAKCWYGATTLVVSRDGGLTFQTPPSPDNVLATLPWRFAPGKLRAGVAGPKVVLNPHDGMVYVMVNHFDRNRRLRAGECLLRGSGDSFNDWRAWDGQAFSLDMESPYVITRTSGDCVQLLPFIGFSLKYVPAIDRFVALGVRGFEVVYAFSKDLISWSAPRVLMETRLWMQWQPGMDPPRSYFSLLDPTSSSINFDTLEKRPYLYFVQYRVAGDRIVPGRDLYRMPVAIK